MKRFILAIALVLIMVVPCFGSGILFIENCTPNTMVGGVAWNADKTDYMDAPELNLVEEGGLIINVPAGEYGLTHYRPKQIVQQDGQTFLIPAAILDYVDVEVIEGKETYIEFGCE